MDTNFAEVAAWDQGGVAQMSRADDDAERSDAEEWRR
jgi:hypothetical protein